MKPKKSYLLLIIVILTSTKMFSQSNYVKLSIGGIRNFTFRSDDTNSLSFYPELYFGGKFFVKGLQWELGAGYWDDGIDSLLPFSDHTTYNYSSFIAAYRLKFVPRELDEEFNVPLKLIAGISYHNINVERVWGDGPHVLINDNREEELFYYDVGLELYLFVFNNLNLIPRALIYFPINETDRISNDFRYSLSVGAEYVL